MIWWQTLIVTLATYIVTKSVDFGLSFLREKRDFQKKRKDLALNDLEKLKDEVGSLYELAANWKSYALKQEQYAQAFEADHLLLGRFQKYGDVAQAARDTIHWCKLVMTDEKESSSSSFKTKSELAEKHKQFLAACDAYLDNLVK